MTFWKRQKDGDDKNFSGGRGVENWGEITGRAQCIFRAVKIFRMV